MGNKKLVKGLVQKRSTTPPADGQKESTAMLRIGPAVKGRKGNGSLLKEASADDPIYTRGFAIGGYYSKASLPATPKTSLEPSKTPSSDDMMPSNE